MCAVEYYTYDDYCQWKGDWELIYGLPLAMAPAPMITHQAIAYEIVYELKASTRECKECLVFGEADWKINDDTIVTPDVVLICNETNEAYMTKAPEIIVEVISKSTAKRYEKTKFKLYEEEKVQYYIIVYPKDLKAKIYRLENGKYTKEGDFLTESYDFEETTCKASINFDSVFRRFRT
jgi:Uma2 family endonuclease